MADAKTLLEDSDSKYLLDDLDKLSRVEDFAGICDDVGSRVLSFFDCYSFSKVFLESYSRSQLGMGPIGSNRSSKFVELGTGFVSELGCHILILPRELEGWTRQDSSQLEIRRCGVSNQFFFRASEETKVFHLVCPGSKSQRKIHGLECRDNAVGLCCLVVLVVVVVL